VAAGRGEVSNPKGEERCTGLSESRASKIPGLQSYYITGRRGKGQQKRRPGGLTVRPVYGVVSIS